MTSNSSWIDIWANSQKQLWDAWSQAGTQQPDGLNGAALGKFWQESLEQWWQTVAPNSPQDVAGVYDKMLESGKHYFLLAEQFLENVAGNEVNQLDAMNQWLESMRSGFVDLASGKTDNIKGMPEFIDYWTAPVETWNKMAESLSPLHDEMQKHAYDAQKQAAGAALPQQLLQLLSVPALGLFRESQEEYQKLSQLIMDYQNALRAYKAAYATTTAKSLQAIQKRLKSKSDAGDESINSLRGMYDLWVEVFEESYAEFAMSEEYQQLYGDLVNTLMAVQKQGGKLTDAHYAKLNLPSRSEIDVVEKRVHEIRRDNFKLRATIADLQARLSALESSKDAGKGTGKAARPTTAKAAATTAKSTASKGGKKS